MIRRRLQRIVCLPRIWISAIWECLQGRLCMPPETISELSGALCRGWRHPFRFSQRTESTWAEIISGGELPMRSAIISIREAMPLRKWPIIILPYWHRQRIEMIPCGSNIRTFIRRWRPIQWDTLPMCLPTLPCTGSSIWPTTVATIIRSMTAIRSSRRICFMRGWIPTAGTRRLHREIWI